MQVFLKINKFISYNLRCKCLSYILIKFLAIITVSYLFLSTKRFSRGRLIWNINASPKMISDMLIRNIQSQNHIENVKSTCYWQNFELKTHTFSHIVLQGEMCITSHNPLWRMYIFDFCNNRARKCILTLLM